MSITLQISLYFVTVHFYYNTEMFTFFVGKFVVGRVIKAMQANWHPDCFRCEICNEALADSGFVKNAGRSENINVF